MAIKLERDLSPKQKEIFTRACSAFDLKNYDYCITLLQDLLKAEPTFLAGRQRLRACEIKKYQGLSGLNKQMITVKVAPLQIKGSSALKKDPAEAIVLAEEILALNPFDPKGNALLADAAMQSQMPELAALAYETIREGNPKDKENLHRLAKVYMSMGEAPKAEATYNRILSVDPRDGEALSGLKNASAAHASRSGGWETASDFRDALKDKSEAEKLEQASKVVKSVEAIDQQIQAAYEKFQANPTNVLYARQIAQLAEQKEDFQYSLDWYRHAYALTNESDNALEKKISDLELKLIDTEIDTLKENGADPALLEEAIQRRNQIVLEAAQKRVTKYPNDYQFRFELGEALFKVGQYREALRELQLGTKQPNVRLQALNLSGCCYWQLSMLDLAKNTFSSASAEIPIMDGTKKEIVYNLAQVLEATGDKTAAIEQYKQIYQVDMAYRDVAKKVEESYGTGNDPLV